MLEPNNKKTGLQLSILNSSANILLIAAFPLAFSLFALNEWVHDGPAWFYRWGFYLSLAIMYLPLMFMTSRKGLFEIGAAATVYIGTFSYYGFLFHFLEEDTDTKKELAKVVFESISFHDLQYILFSLGSLCFPVMMIFYKHTADEKTFRNRRNDEWC